MHLLHAPLHGVHDGQEFVCRIVIFVAKPNSIGSCPIACYHSFFLTSLAKAMWLAVSRVSSSSESHNFPESLRSIRPLNGLLTTRHSSDMLRIVG